MYPDRNMTETTVGRHTWFLFLATEHADWEENQCSGGADLVVEIVSPSNKKPGPGREAYLAKQAEVVALKLEKAMKDAQKAFYGDIPGFYFERRITWHFGTAALQDVHMVNDGTLLMDRIWKKH